MTPPQLQQLVVRARSAIKFPAAAWALWKAATDPELDAQALRQVLERDPLLSVQVLKLANSAAYGRAGSVADLSRAIALLGRREIADMALIAANSSGFSELENRLLRHVDFWVHSVSCARLARDLAPAVGASSDEAFAGGLLHDIGHLLLFSLCSDQMTVVLEEAIDENAELYAIERRHFGFDHAALGAAVLRSWNLPPELCDQVALHHDDPETIADPLQRVVALANRGASFVEADEHCPQDVGEALAAQLGCPEAEVNARLLAIHTRAESICTALRR